MDATQADAEPTKSDGMDASPEVSRSVENDGNNENVKQNEAAPSGLDGELDSLDSPEALAKFMARVTQEPPPGGEGDTQPEAEANANADDKAPSTEEAAPKAKPEAKKPAEQTTDDEEDDAPLDLAKLPTRYRLQVREDDEVGRLAAALKKRNKDWSLEDAVSAARKRLGKDEPPAPAADSKTSTQPKDESAAPAKDAAPKPEDEVKELEAKVKELRAAKAQANKEVDMEKVAELDAQLDDLRDKLMDAKVAAKAPKPEPAKQPAKPDAKPAPVADPAEAAAYDAKFDASLERATNLYPDATKADTAFGKRMAEIDRMLEKEGDPLFHSPDKPFRVAAMVAAELGVAPKSVTSSAKPSAASAAKTAGPRSLAPIASGESRTTTTRTQTAPTVAAIQGLQTPEDLDNFLSKVGATRF